MTLRIMLLGLVASMGFELPSGPEGSCWIQSSRDWVHARLADLSGSVVEADRPDAEPTDCPQAEASASIKPPVIVEEVKASSDLVFAAVTEAMATEFAADSMTMRDEGAPTEDVPAILASEATTSVGLPVGEEPASLDALMGEADQVDVVNPDDLPGEATTRTDALATRADRVSSAVRMTREAIQAWADLMQESPEEACPAH